MKSIIGFIQFSPDRSVHHVGSLDDTEDNQSLDILPQEWLCCGGK